MGAIQVPGFNPAINWTTLVLKYGNIGAIQSVIGPWRPPQWNQQQLYSITVTEVVTESVSSKVVFQNQTQNINPNIRQSSQTTTYFFDAILRAEHDQELVHTEHPIQNGAAIVDHCYMKPARVTLEIGVSDCMARYAAGQFTSSGSKSISAYQTLLDIQSKRVPLTLSTRLNQYENMVIERIAAFENKETKFSLRASVTFAQIIMAELATTMVPASARPDATDLTNEGTKQPLPPDPTVQNSTNLTGFPQ